MANGERIGGVDILIVGTVVVHDETVLTRNVDELTGSTSNVLTVCYCISDLVQRIASPATTLHKVREVEDLLEDAKKKLKTP